MALFEKIARWFDDGVPHFDKDMPHHCNVFLKMVSQVWLNEELVWSEHWNEDQPERLKITKLRAGTIGWIEYYKDPMEIVNGVRCIKYGNVVLVYKTSITLQILQERYPSKDIVAAWLAYEKQKAFKEAYQGKE